MTATDTPASQALEKRNNGGEQMIEEYKGSFAQVLPTHLKPEMFIRLSQGALRRNADLAKAAHNNPGSFLSALLDCARLGLEPGDTYHLIPFGNEVTGIVDYKGEVELIYRAGEVRSIKAEVVHEKDHFDWRPGDMERPIHEADWFSDRGRMIGVYAYAVMRSGATSRVIVMNETEINKHKAMSRGHDRASSPWQKWPGSMWLKTVTHELKKWVPSSAEYRQQVLRQNAVAGETADTMGVDLTASAFDAPDMPEPNAGSDQDIIDAEIIDGPDDQADDDGPATAFVPMTDDQSNALGKILRARNITGDARFALLSEELGRDIKATKQVSSDEAAALITRLQPPAADDAA